MADSMHTAWKALEIFFHPESPAAIYKDPRRFIYSLFAFLSNCYLKVLNVIHPYNKVVCIICGWKGRQFGYTAAISVLSFKANEICLGCRANSRTRILIDTLCKNTDLTKKKLLVADIGGTKSTRKFFEKYKNIQYLIVDKFKDFSDVKSDVTNIDLSTNSIDIILCCHTLEHVENYKNGIEELFRILKPKGCGVIAVPQTAGLGRSKKTMEPIYKGYGHVWRFGADFADKLADAGFRVSTFYRSEINSKDGDMPYHVVSKL